MVSTTKRVTAHTSDAVKSWCSPLPLLRRLGYRISSEMEEERYALKVLRSNPQELTASSAHPGGAA